MPAEGHRVYDREACVTGLSQQELQQAGAHATVWVNCKCAYWCCSGCHAAYDDIYPPCGVRHYTQHNRLAITTKQSLLVA